MGHFSMIGLFILTVQECPIILTTPTLTSDYSNQPGKYYKKRIGYYGSTSRNNADLIKEVRLNGKKHAGYRISHDELKAGMPERWNLYWNKNRSIANKKIKIAFASDARCHCSCKLQELVVQNKLEKVEVYREDSKDFRINSYDDAKWQSVTVPHGLGYLQAGALITW